MLTFLLLTLFFAKTPLEDDGEEEGGGWAASCPKRIGSNLYHLGTSGGHLSEKYAG